MRIARCFYAVFLTAAVLAPVAARAQSAAPGTPSLDQLALPPSSRFT